MCFSRKSLMCGWCNWWRNLKAIERISAIRNTKQSVALWHVFVMLIEIKTISNLKYMVLRRNMQYWFLIWIGVYFTAVTSDLAVNKLARAQSIFRLFFMVFSHKKYKVSPAVASLKLGICPWWLVIAFLPFSLWGTAPIRGMSLLSLAQSYCSRWAPSSLGSVAF